MPLCSTSWRKRSSARLHRLHKYHAGDLGNRTGQGVPRRVYRTLRTQVSWTAAGGRQFLPVSLLQETGSVSAGADRAAHHRERKRKRRGIICYIIVLSRKYFRCILSFKERECALYFFDIFRQSNIGFIGKAANLCCQSANQR